MNVLIKNSPNKKMLIISRRYSRPSSNLSTVSGVIPNETNKITVCPREMELFNELSKVWWEEEGPMKLLHRMVPTRIDILKKHLHKAGKIDLMRNPYKPFEGLNVLEVGCGGGILSEAVAKLGAQVTAVDAAQDILQVAMDHLETNPSLSSNLKYVNETIEDFSLVYKDHFDVLISSEVIEHVADKESFTKFSIDCLRPGGSVFFTTMNRTAFSGFYYIWLFENVRGAIPKGAHEYEKFVRPYEMADLFKRNKCCPTDLQGFAANAITLNWYETPFKFLSFAMHGIKQ